MSKFAKCVAIAAAIGVLVVLITPAPDELPCTAGHRHHFNFAVTASSLPLLIQSVINVQLGVAYIAAVRSTDLLSFTCTLLC